MVHDPLSPGEAVRTPVGLTLVALGLFAFVYSLVVVAQVLPGLWALVLLAGAYLAYRSLAVLDSFADAAQRIASVREREVDAEGGAGDREGGPNDASVRNDRAWGSERDT